VDGVQAAVKRFPKANHYFIHKCGPMGESYELVGMNIIRLGDFALCNDHGKSVMTGVRILNLLYIKRKISTIKKA
jgi:hypothetical protein